MQAELARLDIGLRDTAEGPVPHHGLTPPPEPVVDENEPDAALGLSSFGEHRG